jgi:hypothetical protein
MRKPNHASATSDAALLFSWGIGLVVRHEGDHAAWAGTTSAFHTASLETVRRTRALSRILGTHRQCWRRRRDDRGSSIPEELGGLELAPARSITATAPRCLLASATQTVGKHLRDHGAGAGVAPEFMSKQNSALVGTTARMVDDAPCPELLTVANLGSLTSAADLPRLRVRAGISPAAHRGCVCPGSGSRKRGCRARYRGRFGAAGRSAAAGVLTAPVLGGSVFRLAAAALERDRLCDWP